MSETVVKGLLGCVLDVLRRVEIGFADFEVNYVPALSFKLPSARQCEERGLGA